MQYWRVLTDRWKSQEGQTIVELTLLLPLLLLMLMGVVDFARVFHTALAVLLPPLMHRFNVDTVVACACRSTGKAYQGFCVSTSAFPPASFRARGARY